MSIDKNLERAAPKLLEAAKQIYRYMTIWEGYSYNSDLVNNLYEAIIEAIDEPEMEPWTLASLLEEGKL